MGLRIIVVGMLDSVHLGNWLEMFKDEGHEFLLFPSSPHRRVHPKILELARNEGSSHFRFALGKRLSGLPLWAADKVFKNFFRSRLLKWTIHRFSPAIIHSLELQNAGYIASKTLQTLEQKKPIFIVTNYGSDIYWFERVPRHLKLISQLLVQADRYAAECQRDFELAKKLGFEGELLPLLPNAGGFTTSQLQGQLLPASERKIIMIKGYQGWVGRAHVALQAIEAMAEELREFDIVLFSCNLSTKRLAARVAKRSPLRITAFSKGALTHEEMTKLFSQSLIYVGLSLSDGISTSMLESMAMGAIPVQTATACCNEWFSDTGVAIQSLETQEVQAGIRTAIKLALTTNSAKSNRETIRARALREEIAKQAHTFYAL